MNLKSLCVALLVLGFGSSAAAVNPKFLNSQSVTPRQEPLLIYQLLSGPTLIYYKNRNRYHRLAFLNHTHVFNKFTAIRFKNTGLQSIRQIVFRLSAYGDGYRPVFGADHQPVVKRLVAKGVFAPGSKHTLVNANVVWSLPAGNGLGCVRLSGLRIVYADGSSTQISSSELKHHLVSRLNNQCGIPPRIRAHPHDRWIGPAPFIAGVYPPKWMVIGEKQLYRQPFIPPSASQALCAVGSFLEESCASGKPR